MSTERKRGQFNERVILAHERKEWIEENKRLERMEREAALLPMQRRKRLIAQQLVAMTVGLCAAKPRGFSI
jgi:hypothetical protein